MQNATELLWTPNISANSFVIGDVRDIRRQIFETRKMPRERKLLIAIRLETLEVVDSKVIAALRHLFEYDEC